MKNKNKQNKRKLKIIKFFILIYIVSFLIFNWSDVSWLFNYDVVGDMISGFFNPYPGIDASSIDPYFYPNHSHGVPSGSGQKLKQVKTTYTDKQNILEIPKISASVPIIFSKSADKTSLAKDLKSGVAYYPGSVYPGQIGQIVILGHSAPLNWPQGDHYWEFSRLNELIPGDTIFIDRDNKQYTYTVKRKTIIEKGENIITDGLTADGNILTLISCWPPGKNYQRIAVQAELDG